MPSHQKHHFVPAAYYKPWCADADGKLTCFHWERGRFLINRANPRSIAKEHHLYALEGAPQVQHVSLETEFFTPHVDDPGAVVLQTIIAKGINSLTSNQRHGFVRYLMALAVRNPDKIRQIKAIGKEMLQQELRRNPDEYEAIKIAGAPDSLEECVASWYRDNFGLVMLPKIIDSPNTHSDLEAMHWWCYDFRYSSVELLTCDRPLIWHKRTNDSDFFLALPITPRLGFFVTNDSRTEDKFCELGATTLARKFNESIIVNAAVYVYGVHDGAGQFIRSRLKRSNP